MRKSSYLPWVLGAVLGVLAGPSGTIAVDQAFDPLLLNIRMSPVSLRPPAEFVKESWTLEGYRLGPLGPQAPRAAIIDDENRHRLLILSATEEGTVMVYRLGNLPVDVARRLHATMTCARSRHCRQSRLDPAGEVGCLAVCLLENLHE